MSRPAAIVAGTSLGVEVFLGAHACRAWHDAPHAMCSEELNPPADTVLVAAAGGQVPVPADGP